ncbi:MAG: hypothetical protein K6G50_03305 [bacterium]|nr:hypothetical protein [bacterium]
MDDKDSSELEGAFGKEEIKIRLNFSIFGAVCVFSGILCFVAGIYCLWNGFIRASNASVIFKVATFGVFLIAVILFLLYVMIENLRRMVDNNIKMGQMLNEIKTSVKRNEGSDPK